MYDIEIALAMAVLGRGRAQLVMERYTVFT